MHGSEISLDIQEEILVRLEVNDLLRCKSVCKSWNSFISSRRFEKSHLNNTLKKKIDNNEIGDIRIGLGSRSKCQIAGSSNGLVCVRLDSQLLVVNPLTRQVIKLPNPTQDPDLIKQRYLCIGFGYDSSIDDFKLVIGFKNNTCSDKFRLLILTLKSNVWRTVVVGEFNYQISSSWGVLCNGAIHWLFYRKFRLGIVSFDLSKEVFKEIPCPLLSCPRWLIFNTVYDTYKLGTIEDHLCLIFYGSSIHETRLWVLKNQNVQESESIWEHMCYFTAGKRFPGPSRIRMLDLDSSARVCVQRVLSPIESICCFKYDEHVFVESLVSPHGMGNDNGDCNEGSVTIANGGRLKRKRKGTETNSNKTSKGEKRRHQDGFTRGSIKRNHKKKQ